MSLQSRKKITHKELKKDKLVTAYFKTKDWIDQEENKKKLYITVGIIVAVVAIAFFFFLSISTKIYGGNFFNL
ncbi:MAG: hypothetical protein N2510_00735 [Ignavibacteria bacterium]|nr:hypothetical protein [Ignavibacteria bacterium]